MELVVREKTYKILSSLKNREKQYYKVSKTLKGSEGTKKKYIEALIQEGLLKDRRTFEFPRRRFLRLTEKGKKVLELIERIEEILHEV